MESVEWISERDLVSFRLGYDFLEYFGDSDRLWMCRGDIA